ncbi:unnamed protein product [Urochloa humidicola]
MASTALVGIGPYGGNFGTPHTIDTTVDPPIQLNEVKIWSSVNGPGGHINGLSFTYVTQQGNTTTIPKVWGNEHGVRNTVAVSENQDSYLVEVFGSHDNNSVKSISFVTSDGVMHGPYGETTAGKYVDFHIPVQNGQIVAFFANAGAVLNSVGAYVAPLTA